MRLDCPVDGCHASIEGETEDDVMQQAQDHAADVHPEMELDDETVADIRSRIREV
jgi:predicted small metal-binding protein